MLYGVGATYDTKMSRPNALLRRDLAGLSSPLTWVEGLIGMESPQNILIDAQNEVNDSLNQIAGAQSSIQTMLAQAQGYDSSSDATVRGKASNVESEANGLVTAFMQIQQQAQAILSQIDSGQNNPALTKDQANAVKSSADAFSSQVSSFQKSIAQLSKDLQSLVGYATTGPGVLQTLESSAVNSVSTLTWILGGGLMVYFLAPSFLPRLARGFRSAK